MKNSYKWLIFIFFYLKYIYDAQNKNGIPIILFYSVMKVENNVIISRFKCFKENVSSKQKSLVVKAKLSFLPSSVILWNKDENIKNEFSNYYYNI